MLEAGTLPVEPWCLRELRLDLEKLAQTESLFALSNGHVGLRGNLDEGEPNGIPGTYLAGFHERRPLPYAEAGYGYPESGQTVVNVTNGKIIRLLVDDEPFDVRYGRLVAHERTLDLRAGTLQRDAEWISPAGSHVRVRSTRLVSFVHRAVAAIAYEVTPVERSTRVVLQSEIVANEAPPTVDSDDPRISAALDAPLVSVSQDVHESGCVLVHQTRRSGLLMAAMMDNVVESPGQQHAMSTDAQDDWGRTSVVAVLQPGQTLRLVKYVAYGWSRTRSQPALRDQVAAAITAAQHEGWDGLLASQRAYLDEFWNGADVEVDGDPVVQQAVRFGLFHVLQAGARTERRAIAAKGLTGPGYDGHAFWDSEGFVLPVLTCTVPHATADALRWRHTTLPLARERARALGLQGAAFPWRTIDGEETSAYWPAGTAAFHVNAGIARAIEAYRLATGDLSLERECGLEMLIETARLWLSLGHHAPDGAWHIDGVTGPDEYSAVADDNVFTNLLAARNLRAAADACARHPALARTFDVDTEEMAAWRDAARAVHVPYDEGLQVHPQSARFTHYAEWDFDASRGRYPLMLHAPYFQLYRKQVIKQADLVLAMHWCDDAFSHEDKARNVDYYERRTVRDSSLSAVTQAVMCAEVGHLELAYDYLHETALVDLRDVHGNTRDGLHMASLASTWTALVEGFGGLREMGGVPALAPALPEGIRTLTFHFRWQGTCLRVRVDHQHVECSLAPETEEGQTLRFRLYGEEVEVARMRRRGAASDAATPRRDGCAATATRPCSPTLGRGDGSHGKYRPQPGHPQFAARPVTLRPRRNRI
jgi:alpha,alpha-trehalose phosphorylase